LPRAWDQALAEIATRDPLDALARFWDGCDHDRLAGWDDEFVAEVRRSLCVPCSVRETRG